MYEMAWWNGNMGLTDEAITSKTTAQEVMVGPSGKIKILRQKNGGRKGWDWLYIAFDTSSSWYLKNSHLTESEKHGLSKRIWFRPNFVFISGRKNWDWKCCDRMDYKQSFIILLQAQSTILHAFYYSIIKDLNKNEKINKSR